MRWGHNGDTKCLLAPVGVCPSHDQQANDRKSPLTDSVGPALTFKHSESAKRWD